MKLIEDTRKKNVSKQLLIEKYNEYRTILNNKTLEKLKYENLLLRIENERLKKGYTSKEADLAKRKK